MVLMQVFFIMIYIPYLKTFFLTIFLYINKMGILHQNEDNECNLEYLNRLAKKYVNKKREREEKRNTHSKNYK